MCLSFFVCFFVFLFFLEFLKGDPNWSEASPLKCSCRMSHNRPPAHDTNYVSVQDDLSTTVWDICENRRTAAERGSRSSQYVFLPLEKVEILLHLALNFEILFAYNVSKFSFGSAFS